MTNVLKYIPENHLTLVDAIGCLAIAKFKWPDGTLHCAEKQG